ncbi:MAG TPA: J domain-containing protein [Coleofasciculaceae cyanobacterium]|jgi:curved DNA-binding protein CbpA
MIQAEQYYRILELEPGASPEEIHQGYLDLTWVWHPDRFAGNPRLQEKAQHKLQQLNEAHERLRSFRATRQTKDLRAKSKPQPSSTPHKQSSTNGLHQPTVNQAWTGDNEATVENFSKRVSFKGRDVNEWLD